jgi:hypothetical protein
VKKLALVVIIIAAFAVPATAVAGTNGYTNVAGVDGSTGGGGPTSTGGPTAGVEAVASSGDSSSVLPFTGLELAIMLGVGVVLLGTGLALRRARTTE